MDQRTTHMVKLTAVRLLLLVLLLLELSEQRKPILWCRCKAGR